MRGIPLPRALLSFCNLCNPFAALCIQNWRRWQPGIDCPVISEHFSWWLLRGFKIPFSEKISAV
jgi:hypothetical protein